MSNYPKNGGEKTMKLSEQPRIYDTWDGIDIEFPIMDGVCIKIAMGDNQAHEMINIIKNKLNARS